MKLSLKKKVQETKDAYSFIFQPPQKLSWTAGQYMYFTLEHKNPDSRGISRYFTIASAPFEKVIMVTTKFASSEGSSFKKALRMMGAGDSIEASAPKGKFFVKDAQKKHVCVAGGIGITPFRSIILDLDHKKALKNILLFYTVHKDAIIFKHTLEAAADKWKGFALVYANRSEINDIDFMGKYIHDMDEAAFMISGPMGLVKNISGNLKGRGVGKQNIITDYFPGYDHE